MNGYCKAALLLGATFGAVAPTVAQIGAVAPPARRPAAVAADATPEVTPTTTAATRLPVASAPATDGGRPVPAYRPDGGGPLSGLPWTGKSRRDDAVAEPTPAPITTLTEAVTLAYRTNPQLLAARAQARAADYRIPQARSAYGPTLNANGAYTFTRSRAEVIPGLFSRAQGWNSTASLILNQPLFTFGRNAAAEAGAFATSQFQRETLRITEAQVLSDVISVYVSVLRDAAAVTIARQNMALLDRQYDENAARYRVRDLTLTDIQQTQTRLALGRAQLAQAQGQLGVSQKQFLQFVGAPPGALAAPDLLNVTFGSLAATYAYAEMNSPVIRAAQSREKVSRAAINAARAESAPRVDLRGTADYGSVSPYTDQLRTTQLIGQVVVSAPIIDSGLRRARTGEAREANQSDWRLVDQAYRDIRQSIGSSWDQIASAREAIIGYRTAIEAAQRAYEGAVIQQRAGDRTTLDVLDLARDLLNVRTNYNITVANEYAARAGLLAAAGMLEAPMIVPGFSGYDADEHYDRVRRKADIPLITPLLSGVDHVIGGDTHRDRASRDAGAQQALDESLPLPPAAP